MDTQCCNEDYFIEGKWVVASPEKKDFAKIRFLLNDCKAKPLIITYI